MHKENPFLALLLLCLVAVPGWAGQGSLLLGQIQALDLAGGTMTVQMHSRAAASGKLVRVALPERLGPAADISGSAWGGCLSVGRRVEVWGEHRATQHAEFVARTIRGCSLAGCEDPTGVRARLYRNKHYPGRLSRCRE